MSKLYVRLKPYNPQRGYHVKRYSRGSRMFTTDEQLGRPVWYAMDEAEARELSKLTQNGHEEGRPLFDIVTEDEYQRIVEGDEQIRLATLGLVSATVGKPVPRDATDLTAAPPAEKAEAPRGRAAAIPVEAPAAVEPVVEPAPEPTAEPTAAEPALAAPTPKPQPPAPRSARAR